jgi:hypothetical protein
MFAAGERAIALSGWSSWSIDLGTGPLWAHGSGPIQMTGNQVTAYTLVGSDIIVASYDWVSP